MPASSLCTFHGGAATTVRSNNARTAIKQPIDLVSIPALEVTPAS
jgi:hypothetical protein